MKKLKKNERLNIDNVDVGVQEYYKLKNSDLFKYQSLVLLESLLGDGKKTYNVTLEDVEKIAEDLIENDSLLDLIDDFILKELVKYKELTELEIKLNEQVIDKLKSLGNYPNIEDVIKILKDFDNIESIIGDMAELQDYCGIIDYDSAEMIMKDGDLIRNIHFLNEVTNSSASYFKIDGYGNLMDLSFDNVLDFIEEIINRINNYNSDNKTEGVS